MNYYPHHIGDYTTATAHLSMIEDGAYRRLLDLYYSTEKPLPTDPAKLYRLVRVITKQDRQAIDSVLSEFFTHGPDGWRHKRCDAEIAKAQDKSHKAKTSAAQRWDSNRNANASPNASPNAMRTHSEGNAPNNQEPITNNQEPITNNQEPKKPLRVAALSFDRPPWLPKEWDEFERHRIEKKSRLTPTARKRCIESLSNWRDQGHDVAQILATTIRNGWTGLFAPSGKTQSGNQSVADAWSRGPIEGTAERVSDAGG